MEIIKDILGVVFEWLTLTIVVLALLVIGCLFAIEIMGALAA
tara:strand:+ start:536 stop:661 length:126 start_codon:yes stop_codon:yes gene_type:complete